MATITSTKVLLSRLEQGLPLRVSHSSRGRRFFIEVDGEVMTVASAVVNWCLAEGHLLADEDGLFPGFPQTYRLAASRGGAP